MNIAGQGSFRGRLHNRSPGIFFRFPLQLSWKEERTTLVPSTRRSLRRSCLRASLRRRGVMILNTLVKRWVLGSTFFFLCSLCDRRTEFPFPLLFGSEVKRSYGRFDVSRFLFFVGRTNAAGLTLLMNTTFSCFPRQFLTIFPTFVAYTVTGNAWHWKKKEILSSKNVSSFV